MSSCKADIDCYPFCCVKKACAINSLCSSCKLHSQCASYLCYNNKCTDELPIQIVVYLVGPLVIIICIMIVICLLYKTLHETRPDSALSPSSRQPQASQANNQIQPNPNAIPRPPFLPVPTSNPPAAGINQPNIYPPVQNPNPASLPVLIHSHPIAPNPSGATPPS